MKRLILILPILFFAAICWSQQIAVSLFAINGQYHFPEELQQSQLDTNDVFSRISRETGPRIRPSFNLTFKEGDFIEFSGMVFFQEYQALDFFFNQPFDTTRIFGIPNQVIGTQNRQYYELQIDYFWDFPQLQGERLSTYWGFGVRGYSSKYEFSSDEKFDYYSSSEKRNGAFFLFNTRLHYEFKNPKIQVHGVFGIQTLDLSKITSFSGNPALTNRQQDNFLFDMDLTLDPFWKIGFTYSFASKEKLLNKNRENTNE